MIERFREVENSYIESFSRKEDRGDQIVFWDARLPDMYAFNCTLIKNEGDGRRIADVVTSKLAEARSSEQDFLQLVLHPKIEVTDGLREHLLRVGSKLQTHLYMKLGTGHLDGLLGNEDCVVIRASTEAEFAEGQELDVETSTESGTPAEFARRKSLRKREVFQEPGKQLFSYLCYSQGRPIGKCELYIKDEYAKIEDFVVLGGYQRKGFGTAILKKAISDASGLGAKHIYLLTDKDDTPREMYRKLGFEIIGEETQPFWSAGSTDRG